MPVLLNIGQPGGGRWQLVSVADGHAMGCAGEPDGSPQLNHEVREYRGSRSVSPETFMSLRMAYVSTYVPQEIRERIGEMFADAGVTLVAKDQARS